MEIHDYLTASSVEEALAGLASLRGNGRVIAGGTDLMIQLASGDRSANGLVDITRIPALTDIRRDGDLIVVGAACTFTQIEASPLITQSAPLLAEAASWVGSPQIRNVGTLAGNVINAMPAADGSIALLALDAEAEIANLTGRQWVALNRLFVSPGVSRVDASSEILTAFRFHIRQQGEGSAFERLARRKAVSLPVIDVAATMMLGSDGETVRDVRITVGPVAPTPLRCVGAESALRCQRLTDTSIRAAAEAAVAEAKPRASLLRAGKEYRQELVRVLVGRALTRAAQSARR